jgi:hypothetical protein
MKRLPFALTLIALASLVFVAFRPLRSSQGMRPLVDVRSLPVNPVVGAQGSTSAKIVKLKTIPLPPEAEGMLGGFRFDQSGSLWFHVLDGEVGRFLSLDPSTGSCKAIGPPLAGTQPPAGEFAFTDGGLYVVANRPPHQGAIAFMKDDGSVGGVIQTGSFLPSSMAVDDSGRLWVLGQLLSSTNKGASYVDGQLRTYDSTGHLLEVAAGGWSAQESSDVRLTAAGAGVTIAVAFSSQKVVLVDGAEAKRFASPFAPARDWAQKEQDAPPAVSVPSQVLGGIWDLGADELWYGLTAAAPGVFQEGHLRICSADGRALSADLLLPSSYRNLVAVDKEGLLYFIKKDMKPGGGLDIIIARLQR